MAVTIKLVDNKTIPLIVSAFRNSEWKTSEIYYQKLLEEQNKNERVFIVAFYGDKVAGFVTIKWQAYYPPFAEQRIPEIRDLRVIKKYRRHGIATALMDEAEKRVFKRSKVVGLGVGLYADYGPAQQMYIRRDYIPDGQGLMYRNRPVKPGHDVFVDDDLVIFLVKEKK